MIDTPVYSLTAGAAPKRKYSVRLCFHLAHAETPLLRYLRILLTTKEVIEFSNVMVRNDAYA